MSARILVIEDNPASMDLMVYLLQAFGHKPLQARDGMQGIELTRQERPDLILCDIQLPVVDGHEVCRQLKSDPDLCKIPLVAVTAYAMVGDREKLLAEGFNGYIGKPIQPQVFMDQVMPYLQRKEGLAKSPAPAERAVPAAQQSRRHGNILVVDNSAVNLELAQNVLEPFGYRVTKAGSVDEALRLLEEQTPDAILADVHMPVKDGFDLIDAVKSDSKTSAIPFLFITATSWGQQDRQRGLAKGADRFIVRPIDPLKLVAEIDSCLLSREAAR